MTPSKQNLSELEHITDCLAALEDKFKMGDWPPNEGFDACGRLLGLASRLYVAAGEAQEAPEKLPELNITPTEVAVVSSALLRDQNMTPFDIWVWFNRVAAMAAKSNSKDADFSLTLETPSVCAARIAHS